MWLRGYDSVERDYLVNGFKNGFRIGHEGIRCSRVCKNQKSVHDKPQVMRDYIRVELEAGRLAGPFSSIPFQPFTCSPLGLREKSTKGKWRVIQNLSAPYDGTSVNDGIPFSERTTSYPDIQQAIDYITELLDLGFTDSVYLAKTDIKSAFRIVPIAWEDLGLLGFEFEGMFYHDLVMTMGSGSSCRIFQRIANAINWIARNKLHIRRTLTYVDDTLIIESNRDLCFKRLQLFSKVCNQIGFVIADEKTEGPSERLTFLGIELDSIDKCARLPLKKVTKCNALIVAILERRSITLRELQSIIGLLNFACSVIQPGRCFLRRLIDLTIGKKSPNYWINLNVEVKRDLNMWSVFLESYNGVTFFRDRIFITNQDLKLYTDAASKFGYGAVYKSQWFYGLWGELSKEMDIMWMELFAVVAAFCTWAHEFANRSVLFYTDNEALVFVLNKQSSKNSQIMKLIRFLVLKALKYNILFRAKHIRGVDNIMADCLSRLDLQGFRRRATQLDWILEGTPRLLDLDVLPDNILKRKE